MDGNGKGWNVALVLAALCLLAYPSQSARAETERTLKDVEAVGRSVEARRLAVEAELTTLGPHAWAGEYYQGDGLGSNTTMSLAPHAGVAATETGCLGLYNANLGAIEQTEEGVLHLRFDAPRDAGPFDFPEELQLVRWGERRYLIPPSRMLDFVNAMHDGSEPRSGVHGQFLLAKGDEAKPAPGFPDLPERYLSGIRNESLDAGVLRIEVLSEERDEDFCVKRYRITLDRGALDGLAPGVTLSLKSPPDRYEDLKIDAVGDTSASGEVSIYESECDAPQDVPDRRWIFTTGHFVPTADITP